MIYTYSVFLKKGRVQLGSWTLRLGNLTKSQDFIYFLLTHELKLYIGDYLEKAFPR